MEVDEEALLKQLINSNPQKESQTSTQNKDNYSFQNNLNSTNEPVSEIQDLSNFNTFNQKLEQQHQTPLETTFSPHQFGDLENDFSRDNFKK